MRPAFVIGIAALIVLSGCASKEKVDCLDKFADAYCASINETHFHYVFNTIAAEHNFNCRSIRRSSLQQFDYLATERTQCELN